MTLDALPRSGCRHSTGSFAAPRAGSAAAGRDEPHSEDRQLFDQGMVVIECILEITSSPACKHMESYWNDASIE